MANASESTLSSIIDLYSGHFINNDNNPQGINVVKGRAERILNDCAAGIYFSISVDRDFIAAAAKTYQITGSPSERDLQMINSVPNNNAQIDELLGQKLEDAIKYKDLPSLFITARFMNDIGLSNSLQNDQRLSRISSHIARKLYEKPEKTSLHEIAYVRMIVNSSLDNVPKMTPTVVSTPIPVPQPV